MKKLGIAAIAVLALVLSGCVSVALRTAASDRPSQPQVETSPGEDELVGWMKTMVAESADHQSFPVPPNSAELGIDPTISVAEGEVAVAIDNLVGASREIAQLWASYEAAYGQASESEKSTILQNFVRSHHVKLEGLRVQHQAKRDVLVALQLPSKINSRGEALAWPNTDWWGE